MGDLAKIEVGGPQLFAFKQKKDRRLIYDNPKLHLLSSIWAFN